MGPSLLPPPVMMGQLATAVQECSAHILFLGIRLNCFVSISQGFSKVRNQKSVDLQESRLLAV